MTTNIRTAYRMGMGDMSSLSNQDREDIYGYLESRGVLEPRKEGMIKEAVQGAGRGLLGLGLGVASTLDEAGLHSPYEYLQGVAERNQQLEPYPGYKASNLLDLTGVARTAGEGIGQFFLPALVGLATTAATGGASAPALASQVALTFARTYGGEAKSFRELMPNRSPGVANALAVVSSGLQSFIEVFFGPEVAARAIGKSLVSNVLHDAVKQKAEKLGKDGAKKWLFGLAKSMVKGAASEGVMDEGFQLMVNNVVRSIGEGKMDISSPGEYAENIAGGAIPGALFGGAEHMMSSHLPSNPAENAQQTPKESNDASTGVIPKGQQADASGTPNAGQPVQDQASSDVRSISQDLQLPAGEERKLEQAPLSSSEEQNPHETKMLEQPQNFTMREGKTQAPPDPGEIKYQMASRMAVGALSQMTGAPIRILDDQTLAAMEKQTGSQINGFHDPATGMIYLNPNAPDGVTFTFGHELLHKITSESPDLLKAFNNILLQDLTEKGKQEIQNLKQKYSPIMASIEEREKRKLSKRERKTFRINYVKEEFGADTLGKILKNPENVEELAYRFELQRAGLGEKFLMQIKHFLEQAMKKLKGYVDKNRGIADLFYNYEAVHDEAMKALTKLAERQAIRTTPQLENKNDSARSPKETTYPKVDVTGLNQKVTEARDKERDALEKKLVRNEQPNTPLAEKQHVQEPSPAKKEDILEKPKLLGIRNRQALEKLAKRLTSIPPKNLSSVSPKKLETIISAMEQNDMVSSKEYAFLKKVLNKIKGISEKVTSMQTGERKEIEPPKQESYRESVKVKTSSIKVDPSRFQFKSNTEKKTGVDKSNVIGGEYDPVTAGTIYLWEDKHGNKYVVNGHHRLFLANSQKIPYIRADIDREIDGVTEREARTKGALMNIRDGQGQVKDYVDFIKEENIDRKTAEKQGILSRTKGRAGFNIATKAGNTLYPAYKAGQVTDAQAETIANIADGDEGLEYAGLKMSKNMNLDELNTAMNRLKNYLSGKKHRQEQMSLFDMDDSAYKTIVAMAKIISKRKNDLKQDIASIKNSVNKKERATKGGVNVTDKAEVNLREYEKQLAVLSQNVLPKELDQAIINQAVKEGLLSKDDVNISEEMDPDFPLITKEENANDFQLVAESQKEAAAREAKGKQEELDEKERIRKNAIAATPELKFSLRSKPDPEKTKTAYKLFKVDENGNPHALFIDSSQPLRMNQWYDADAPLIENLENLAPGNTYLLGSDGIPHRMDYSNRNQSPSKEDIAKASIEGKRYVYVGENKNSKKTYYNWGVNGSGAVAQFAMRPGWHATNVPVAKHIGIQKNGKVAFRRPNERWFEVELAADKDYNEEARQNPHGDIPEHLPTDGWYSFQTNTNADKKQDWYISGAMKIIRALTKEEADNISMKKGYNPDLPYDRRYSISDLKHGTTADFLRPDVNYIGTGEGAQVYGWGIYATDVLSIAKWYAQADYDRKINEQKQQHLKDFSKFVKERNLYTFTFWPDKQEDLLLWHKSIPQAQILKIKEQAKKESLNIPDNLFSHDRTGGDIYKSLNQDVLHSPRKTSEFLYRAGIDGVKYPAASRGTGDGSKGWNYVAFSDKDIRVDAHIRYSLANQQGNVQSKLDQVNPIQTDDQINQEYADMLDNATVTKPTLPEYVRRATDWIKRHGSIEDAAKEIVKGDTDRILGTFVSRIIMNSSQFKDLPENIRDEVEMNYALQGSEWSQLGRSRQIRNLTLDTLGKIQRVINKLKKDTKEDEWGKLHDDVMKDTGIDIDSLPQDIVNDKDKLDDVLTHIFSKRATKEEKAYEWWINSILSAPQTHIVNALGDVLNFSYELGAKKLMEVATNLLLHRKEGATLQEFRRMWKAFDFQKAWNSSKMNFSREVIGSNNKLYKYYPAIEGKKGERIRLPGRLIRFIDDLTKSLIVPMEATAMAYREARHLGLKGDALERYITNSLQDNNSTANRYAANRALDITFQEAPGEFVKKLLSFKNSDGVSAKIAKYLFPFVQTPVNILKQGMRKSPLGMLTLLPEARKAFQDKKISDQLVSHVAEQILGFSLLGLLGSMLDDDDDLPVITGSSARMGSAEQRFKQNHVPPYSIRIGGKYYSYQRLDPFSTTLALMVDGINAFKDARRGKDAAKAMREFAGNITHMISDKSYLDTLGQILDVVENPESGLRWASSFAASWIPNAMRKTISSADNMIRDNKAYEKVGMDYLKEQFWLVASAAGAVKMAPKVDYFGREITKNQSQDMDLGDYAWNLLSPMKATDSNLDKIEQLVWRYNKSHPNNQYWMGIPSPSGSYKNRRFYLDRESYHDFAIKTGKLAKQQMDIALRKGLLNPTSPTEKDIRLIRNIFSKAHKATKMEFVRKNQVKYF